MIYFGVKARMLFSVLHVIFCIALLATYCGCMGSADVKETENLQCKWTLQLTDNKLFFKFNLILQFMWPNHMWQFTQNLHLA